MDWLDDGGERDCACCGSPLAWGAGACPVCGWMDDPLAGEDGESPANGGLTLTEARLNFRVFGACDFSMEE